MRFGLCTALSRLWIRLVMKTVLPERLRPVTARLTVAPWTRSARLVTSLNQPDALATNGESQSVFAIAVGLLRRSGTDPNCAVRNIGALCAEWKRGSRRSQNSAKSRKLIADFSVAGGNIWHPAGYYPVLPGLIASKMLDRVEFEPLFFAPFVSSVMRVEQQWIDYNGHLNMAYYNVLFDRAVDEAFELLGCGLDYVRNRKHSCFTAEVHVRYLKELHAGDPVRVTFQLLDYDAKRMHYFEQLFHAEEGYVSATSENMSLHVDMTAGKTAAFPPEVAAASRA